MPVAPEFSRVQRNKSLKAEFLVQNSASEFWFQNALSDDILHKITGEEERRDRDSKTIRACQTHMLSRLPRGTQRTCYLRPFHRPTKTEFLMPDRDVLTVSPRNTGGQPRWSMNQQPALFQGFAPVTCQVPKAPLWSSESRARLQVPGWGPLSLSHLTAGQQRTTVVGMDVPVSLTHSI